MAGKKFKNKTCAYCGMPRISTTGDHIFARQFFLEGDRGNLPQVPACARCNGEKSKIEHHLLQLLPLGTNHQSSAELIQTLMPKRAAHSGSKVLRDVLQNPKQSVFLIDQDGRLHEREPALISAAVLKDWCGLVARGLACFHWNVVTPDYDVTIEPIGDQREQELKATARHATGPDRIEQSLGNGTFDYCGFRCGDHRSASIWVIKAYGAMPIGGDPAASRFCATAWAVFIRPGK